MHGSGIGVIMNKHYEIVRTVRSGSATASTDLHEFQLTSSDTALITIYQPRLHESRWVLDSVFQQIDLHDRSVLFHWSALEHVVPADSHVAAGSYGQVGTGDSSGNSWDYFHINSVEKTDAGNYLISARHLDCVLLISGRDGSVIWTLNGDRSSFDLIDFGFRRQHHARLRKDGEHRTVLSIFNNDNDGFTAEGSTSTGLLVEIDHTSRLARKLVEYEAPVSGGVVTSGMGSMSYLLNDNVLLGWGADSAIAEYLPDGTAVWFSQFSWQSWNYRAFKSNWTGRPLQPPALWTYARTVDSPLAFHMSWNGATNVLRWQLHVSNDKDGQYELVASVAKNGFETSYSRDAYSPWAFVEALGPEGSIRNSTAVRTFVPLDPKNEDCVQWHCSSTSSGSPAAFVGWNKTADGGLVLERQDYTRRWPWQQPFAARRQLYYVIVVLALLVCTAATFCLAVRTFFSSRLHHQTYSGHF